MLPDLILIIAAGSNTLTSTALGEPVNAALGHFVFIVFCIVLSISFVLQGEFILKKWTEESDVCFTDKLS